MKATGKPIERIDGVAKVTGKATYTADVPVSALAHAVIVGSTIAKGRVAEIDARDAERADGVLAVLTHVNAPKLPGATAKAGSATRTTPSASFTMRATASPAAWRRPALAAASAPC